MRIYTLRLFFYRIIHCLIQRPLHFTSLQLQLQLQSLIPQFYIYYYYSHTPTTTTTTTTYKMNKTTRAFKPLKMVVPYLKSPLDEKQDTTTPSHSTEPDPSSSSSTSSMTKKDEVFTHDLCSSKSVSERRDGMEQHEGGGSKVGSALSMTKDGEAS